MFFISVRDQKDLRAQTRVIALKNRLNSGERRLPACRSRQLADAGGLASNRIACAKMLRQGCRQLPAGSLCSLDHDALRGVSFRVLAVHVLHNVGLRLQSTCSWEIITLLSSARLVQQALSYCAFWNAEIFPWQACARLAQPAPQANQFHFRVNPSP